MASHEEASDSAVTRKSKRARKPNFTLEELHLLIQTVHQNYDVLYAEGQKKNDKKRKEVWRQLVETINGQGVVTRTKDELQHKYRDLRAEVKRKLVEIQHLARRAASGTPSLVSLTRHEKMIASNITKLNIRGLAEYLAPGENGLLADSTGRSEEAAGPSELQSDEKVIKEEEFDLSPTQDIKEEEPRPFTLTAQFLDNYSIAGNGQDEQDVSDIPSESVPKRGGALPNGKFMEQPLERVTQERIETNGLPPTSASSSTASDVEFGHGRDPHRTPESTSWGFAFKQLYELEERRELRYQQHTQLQKHQLQLQRDILQQQKTILQTIHSCMQLQVQQQDRHHQDVMGVLRHQQVALQWRGGLAWRARGRRGGAHSQPRIPRTSGARQHRVKVNTPPRAAASQKFQSPLLPKEGVETAVQANVALKEKRGRGRPRGSKTKKA